MGAREAGRYTGFVTSMLIFSAILFFVTSRLRWHSQEYYVFVPALLILFSLVIITKRRVTKRMSHFTA